MNDECEIPACGILGKDFLKEFKCNIDYDHMVLTIRTDRGDILLNIFEGPNNQIAIPPRCEVIRHFKVSYKISLKQDQVLNAAEGTPGVMIARSIFDPKSPYLRVINTTNKIALINSILPKSENLSRYNIYSLDEINKTNSERKDKIKNLVTKDVPKYVRKELGELCEQYSDIFALDTDKLTVNNFYEQELKIKDQEPVFVKNYRLPQSHKAEINKQVDKLLESDLIEPSSSEYNSPLILVPKPSINGEKRWRMCVDYRLINKKLVGDRYPLQESMRY